MNSRYNFMTESVVKDEVSNSFYPDPLTLNYITLKIKDLPTYRKMDISSASAFWSVVGDVYGVCEWDDLVLTLNGYAHKNFIKEGDTIIFPSISDMRRSFSE